MRATSLHISTHMRTHTHTHAHTNVKVEILSVIRDHVAGILVTTSTCTICHKTVGIATSTFATKNFLWAEAPLTLLSRPIQIQDVHIQ
jgi:hypothetical protein